MIDLGAWANEEYRVAAVKGEDEDPDARPPEREREAP
jgi:endogenous inhibitor of DNA gyrase (YacG/DUF329 family)